MQEVSAVAADTDAASIRTLASEAFMMAGMGNFGRTVKEYEYDVRKKSKKEAGSTIRRRKRNQFAAGAGTG